VPYVVRPLGTLDPWSLRQKPMRKRLLWHMGVKQMLARASAIHYTATDEQRLAEGTLGLMRGVVIPLGIDPRIMSALAQPEKFRMAHPTLGEAPYVLVMCRLHPKKNLEALVRVFGELTRTQDFRAWKLVIAGEGDAEYTALLRDLVHQDGAEDRILFTGWLTGTDKLAALRGAGLMALPSFQENFGISIIEALACGVPALISTQVNLAKVIANANAGWVVPLDLEVMRETLARALGDDDERTLRGEAGRLLVQEHFVWPAVASELEALYRSLPRTHIRRAA
jgi:glycosyltransferase involved in cell wall biosynthesis